MNKKAFEKDIHLKEKRYSHGYRVVYVGYYGKYGPIYQVQRRLYGSLWYTPCHKKSGVKANFMRGQFDRILEFIHDDAKRRGLKVQ